MQGWISLYRELLEKPIWLQSTPEQRTVLIVLLLMANHKENEWEWRGKRFKAKPGQFVTSLNKILSKCGKGITMSKLRTALVRFEKYNFLTNESSNQNRLITIVNWEIYQSNKVRSNKQINKQLTNNQQTINRQLTTNNNVNNVNKIEEEEYIIRQFCENEYYSGLEKLLEKKGVSKREIKETIKELMRLNITSLKLNDVEGQIIYMEKEKANGKVIRDFPKYFAGGLDRMKTQENISNVYRREQVLEIQQREKRDTSMYYDWLNT